MSNLGQSIYHCNEFLEIDIPNFIHLLSKLDNTTNGSHHFAFQEFTYEEMFTYHIRPP